MISETDKRLFDLIIKSIFRLLDIVSRHSLNEVEANYVLSDAIQYEFEKLYQDLNKLSNECKMLNPELRLKEIRAIRNMVAHDYESVSIKRLYDTVSNDIPVLKSFIEGILD